MTRAEELRELIALNRTAATPVDRLAIRLRMIAVVRSLGTVWPPTRGQA